MLKDVERAAVVITNPTEFAIALEYRMDMDAPVVVAKGRNLLAAQIKEIARWNGIPMVENPSAGACLVPRGGSGAGDSSATLHRGGRNSGRDLAGAEARGPSHSQLTGSYAKSVRTYSASAARREGRKPWPRPLPRPTHDGSRRTKNSAAEWIMPIAAVGLIFVMLVPLPSFLLDLLLATSMTVSVLVLLSAIQILRPSQFSVFPSLLLLLTLFRLSLNLASSRRILLHGNEGACGAGHVIEAFGQFVVGGNYVVGFVLFVALIAIQYMVVAHGAVRTAEVTARFTLDAMPGKQMAIDADLNAGLINEAPGPRPPRADCARCGILRRDGRRGALQPARRDRHHPYYRDQHHRRISDRRLPARHSLPRGVEDLHRAHRGRRPGHHDSVAAGFDGGRHRGDPRLLGRHALSRCGAAGAFAAPSADHRRGSHAVAGGDSRAAQVFLFSAGGGHRISGLARSEDRRRTGGAGAAARGCGRGKKPGKDSVEDLLKLDELSLEVGYGLVALVDQNQGGQLLARVKALRQNLAQQLGFIVPPVHITDNVRLKPKEYAIALRGVEMARWELHQDNLLAISSEGSPRPLPGIPTKEPAFGVAAVWIPPALQNQALASGYAVVDQTSVLATHLAEVVKQHAHELLTRQETKRLLDRLAESHPKLVEELVPKILSLGEVQKTLQQLLREQVSIRDLSTILETLLDIAPANKNPVLLVEAARQALGRALVRPLLSDSGGLRVVTLDRALEDELGRAFGGQASQRRRSGGPAASLCPPHSRWTAPPGRGAGGGGHSGAAVRDSGALPPEAAARTFFAEGGGALAAGGAAGDRGAVGGSFALSGTDEKKVSGFTQEVESCDMSKNTAASLYRLAGQRRARPHPARTVAPGALPGAAHSRAAAAARAARRSGARRSDWPDRCAEQV